MAMALRTAVAAAVAPRGFRRLYSTTFTPPFNFPQATVAAQQREQADPSTNLFVSGKVVTVVLVLLPRGLSKRTTTEKLHEAFSQFGEVVHAKVVTDRVSGYSKGFGFVRYSTLEDAAKGIEGMDGKFLDGWVIFAEYARPRQPPPENHMAPPYGHQ
uniref:RRM domain-containing protein n=1 Tax=Fagus sylvatica TaxID=28930 RepID=A0A2N9GS35_FAGSY